jgi:hypothetical protein
MYSRLHLQSCQLFYTVARNPGFRVQGWIEHDESESGSETYEGVTCHACGRLHLVNPETGKTAGADDRQSRRSCS